MQLTLKRAQTFGRVSDRNSKMPASTFATHTADCSIGSKLRAVEGSVCHDCYATKFEKMYPSVHQGHAFNGASAAAMIAADPEAWAQAIALQITRICDKFNEPFHRWFDAGDIADLAMLEAIVRVCELTPTIKHWLPTRERGILKAFLATGRALPANLVVRLSATMIDDKPIANAPHTSTVHRKGSIVHGQPCEAATRNHQCGPCRACWDPTVENVSYPFHR
jgi:hypothetical protein